MTAEHSADQQWVERYMPIIERAFEVFMERGEWAKATDLRRHFARLGKDVDVDLVLRSKPRYPGELRMVYEEALTLRIRQLRFLPQAYSLIQVCLAATRRAVEAYLSTAEEPKISSTDEMISLQAGGDQQLLVRAGALLQSEHPGPLSGGGYGPDHWDYFVNDHSILAFRDVLSADDFVAAQERIMRKTAQEAADRGMPFALIGDVTDATQGYASSVGDDVVAVKRIFVLMPFQPEWSTMVYEMLKRVVESLDIVPTPTIQRADDITEPGRITDQIVEHVVAADVIVADISGLNPNVMWELGYAHAMQRPTVILNQDIAASPFDLVDHRQVGYASFPTSDDEERIKAAIRSALRL